MSTCVSLEIEEIRRHPVHCFDDDSFVWSSLPFSFDVEFPDWMPKVQQVESVVVAGEIQEKKEMTENLVPGQRYGEVVLHGGDVLKLTVSVRLVEEPLT